MRNLQLGTRNFAKASSSNGRAPDSKSGGWGFKSLLACHMAAQEPYRHFKKEDSATV